jgi:hypothetical protein
MNRLLTNSVATAILIALAACGSLLAQTPNPQQKSKVFGLPVAQPDNSGKAATVPKSGTAAPVENRSTTSTSKTSEADRTNWKEVAKIFVAIEGTRQGKFKGAVERGRDPGFECLTYVLQQQPGAGHKPEIVITKGSDAATSQLLQALETGEPLKTVTLEFVGEGLPGKGVSKATLTGASIVAIQQHFDAKTRGVFEDITLNFTKIEYTEER